MIANKPTKKIMIVCAEKSGDLAGASMIKSLRKEASEYNLEFVGVGGKAMQEQGLKSIFDMSDIAVMGLVEVIPHLRVIMQRIKQTVQAAKDEKIDALVTIDGAEFSFKVAKKVKAELNVPCIHYVSPQVWAWRENRVYKMEKFLDHILALFPFEEKYYRKTSLKCTYVGHPVIERFGSLMPKFAKKTLNKDLRLAIVPGSRKNELKYLLPELAKSVVELKKKFKGIKIVVPVAEGFDKEIFERYFTNAEYLTGEDKFEKLKKCDAAIACSGTVNLELAMLGLPMVVCYKMNNLTYKLAKLLVKVKYISPVNIVANKRVVKELVQDEFTSENVVKSVLPLLKESKQREKMLQELKFVRDEMKIEESCASDKAAKVIKTYL